MCIFDTVDRKSSPCELILILEIRDDAVGYIFFLLFQKVVSHRVEGVRSQFVISDDHLHHVKLHTALDVDIFAFSCSESFDV